MRSPGRGTASRSRSARTGSGVGRLERRVADRREDRVHALQVTDPHVPRRIRSGLVGSVEPARSAVPQPITAETTVLRALGRAVVDRFDDRRVRRRQARRLGNSNESSASWSNGILSDTQRTSDAGRRSERAPPVIDRFTEDLLRIAVEVHVAHPHLRAYREAGPTQTDSSRSMSLVRRRVEHGGHRVDDHLQLQLRKQPAAAAERTTSSIPSVGGIGPDQVPSAGSSVGIGSLGFRDTAVVARQSHTEARRPAGSERPSAAPSTAAPLPTAENAGPKPVSSRRRQ